jgi:hypothetical protein
VRSYRWARYQVDPDDDGGATFLHYLAHVMRKLCGEGDELPMFGPRACRPGRVRLRTRQPFI